MNEKIVLDILNDILTTKGRDELHGLNPNLSLRDDIGLDSIEMAELTVRIEEETGIDIFEDGIVETLGAVLKKLNNGRKN